MCFHRKPLPRVKILVQETFGLQIYRAVTECPYNNGFSYTYKNYLDEFDLLYVPPEYVFAHKDGFALVGKIAGNNSACPIQIGTHLGPPSWADCPGYDLTQLVTEDWMGRAGKTLVGKKQNSTIPWFLLIIIVLVLVGGVIYFKDCSKKTTTTTPPVTSVNTITA